MSFQWRKVGSFNTAAEAEHYCRQQNIAMGDSRIDNIPNGVELQVRENTPGDKADEDPRPYGF